MKENLIAEIIERLNQCKDIALLDLVLEILEKSS